jgi:hypothetical protein
MNVCSSWRIARNEGQCKKRKIPPLIQYACFRWAAGVTAVELDFDSWQNQTNILFVTASRWALKGHIGSFK